MEHKIKTKKTRRTLSALFLLIVSLMLSGVLYLLFIPVDLSRHHARVEALIESRTGLKLSIDGIVFKALPSTLISLKGVKAFQDGAPFFSARSAVLTSSPTGLMRKIPILESVYLDGAELLVKRDPSGRINIEEFLRKKEVTVKALNIKNSAVKLDDEADGQKSVFEITGVTGYMYEVRDAFIYRLTGTLLPRSEIAFSGKGELEASSFSGSGSLRDIDISMFSRYMARGPDNASVKGVMDIDSSYGYDKNGFIKSMVRYKGLKVEYPRALNRPLLSPAGSAGVDVLWHDNMVDLSVKDARLDMGDFSVNGTLKVTGPSAGRTVDMNLSTTRIPFKTFWNLVPRKAIPREAALGIGNVTPLGGGLAVKGLTVNMDAGDLFKADLFKRPGSITLNIILDDIGFKYRGLKESFSGIEGSISLKELAVSFSDIAGRYDKNVIESLNGRLSDLRGKLPYDFSIKGAADAQDALGLARRITQGGYEGLAKKLSMTSAAGEADFSLGVKGALKGGEEAVYSGSAAVRNGSFSYEGFPIRFASIAGGIDFDNRRITFRDLSGESGGSTLAVNGYLEDYSMALPAFDLKANGAVYHETLRPFIKDSLVRALRIEGPVAFKGEAAGRPDSFAANASVDAGKASLEYKKLIKKAPGYPMTLNGSINYGNGEAEVKKARMEFGASVVQAAGRATPGKQAYNFLISSKRLMLSDIDDISPFLTKDFESAGSVSFNVNVSREPGKASPLYKGDILVKDAGFKTTFLPKPVERINASADFEGNRASARITNISTGRTSFNGMVDITDISGRVVNFSLYFPSLHAEDLSPVKDFPEKAGDAQTGQALPSDKAIAVTGTGTIEIKDGSAWGHEFSGLHAALDMGSDVIRIAPLNLTLDKGAVSGNVSILRNPLDPSLLIADFKLSGLDIESMISGSGAKGQILSGRLRGSLSLTAARGATPFTKGSNGKAKLRAENGRLWEFPILSRIFSIVNIVSINELLTEGLPYKTIYGDFDIKDGIIHTDDLLLNSHTMRMSAVGDIDMPGKKIGSVLAIHPFVTLDRIISSIPLAGWIITGKEKSTVSMYFGIEGPLNDPDIYPKPIKTLEKDIFGIIQRVLEAPIEILIPDTDREGKD